MRIFTQSFRQLLAQGRRCLIDRRGAGTVEFALTALVFFGLMLGIIEFGRVLWIANSLHMAVQQAARCGAIASSSCGSTSAVQTFAAGVAGSGVPTSAFTATPQTCSGSPQVCTPSCGYRVSASYAVKLYVPYVSMRPTLQASACFPK